MRGEGAAPSRCTQCDGGADAALRTGASIFASDEILDEAGVAIPDEQEDEVEKFREFLDTITPEDFGRAT